MKHRLLKLAAAVILLAVWAAFSQAQQAARENDEVLTPVITKGDLYPADADAKKEIDEALEKAATEISRHPSSRRNPPDLATTTGPGQNLIYVTLASCRVRYYSPPH